MPKSNPKAQNYNQLNTQLAEIIAWFESGAAEVDQAIAKYEQALELIAQIEKYLKQAENKLTKINADLNR